MQKLNGIQHIEQHRLLSRDSFSAMKWKWRLVRQNLYKSS